MSGSFNLGDYVDVSERIANFHKAHPEGSLQSELTRLENGWLCKAYAYRTPDDARPGVGHAFEPVPGKTPYTKDSEAMNAETSAWGRAIVALGFETKKGTKIASRQEVQARQGAGHAAPAPSSSAGGPSGAAPAQQRKTDDPVRTGTAPAAAASPAVSSPPESREAALRAGDAASRYPIPDGVKSELDERSRRAADPREGATDKQKAAIRALVKKLDLPAADARDPETMTKASASEYIGKLKRLEEARAAA